jgi:FeS assembly SUF system regulator
MFRLNRLTDYAVVVMSQMAQHPGQMRNTSEISQDSNVPLPTVAKILNALSKADLVTAQRGASGGYSLSREAKAIPVSEIIQALEGPIALTACVTGATETCDGESLCPLRGQWNKVNLAIKKALDQVSLEEIAVTALPPASPHEQALLALDEAFEGYERASS